MGGLTTSSLFIKLDGSKHHQFKMPSLYPQLHKSKAHVSRSVWSKNGAPNLIKMFIVITFEARNLHYVYPKMLYCVCHLKVWTTFPNLTHFLQHCVWCDEKYIVFRCSKRGKVSLLFHALHSHTWMPNATQRY